MALDPSNPRSLVGATMGARKRAPPAANSPAAPVPGVDGARLDLHAQTPRGPLRPVEDEMSEIDVKEQIEARLERLAMESRQLAAMLERIAMPAEPKELGPPVTVRLGEPLVAIERRLIAATLVWCDFNKSEAADRLGISRRTIYNFLGELGARSEVYRNDKITADAVLALKPQAIVLSPGPCTPNEAGICCELIGRAIGKVPVLGVCLGHQAIGQVLGGKVVRAPAPMHGKLSTIKSGGAGIFRGLPSHLEVTRYHSLVVERSSLPATLRITAETDDGIVMGVEHTSAPVFGVQFHPESIASEHGHALLANFLEIAGMAPKRRNEAAQRIAI